MTDTTFRDLSTPAVDAAWLNDVNKVVYRALGSGGTAPSTAAEVLANLNIDAVGIDLERDYGVSSTSSTADVKAALQQAIAAAAALANGGVVTVGANLKYGYKVADKTTWPTFGSVTKPVLVQDFSQGSDYGTYPTAYNGAQYRLWFFTPQTSSPGQHDGNTFWIRGAWAPNICVSNDMDLSGARTATDNRRALVTYFVNGLGTWAIGQGLNAGAGLTDEELSNFTLQKYNRAGDTLAFDYAPLVIERKTSYMAYGVGTNAPEAHHHFGRTSGSPTTYIMKVKSDSTVVDVVLEESSATTNKWSVRVSSGTWQLASVANGIAVSCDTTLRRFKVETSYAVTRVAAAYSASMTLDAASGNIFSITATNNTAFTINAPTNPGTGQPLTITIRNTSGGALGVATWNTVFKMAAWTQPGNGNSRSITFYYDGTNWIETSRTASDIPN